MSNRLKIFIDGALSIFDLNPRPIVERIDLPSLRMSDAEFIRQTWASVGDSIRQAAEKFAKDNNINA